MGAASILLYASTDPAIASIILDSPFAELWELCTELAGSYKLIPSVLANYMLGKVRSKIRRTLGFDIGSVSPATQASQCHAPALFVHAIDDELISITHMRRLYDLYAGEKSKIEV
jgi:hypothetical protein